MRLDGAGISFGDVPQAVADVSPWTASIATVAGGSTTLGIAGSMMKEGHAVKGALSNAGKTGLKTAALIGLGITATTIALNTQIGQADNEEGFTTDVKYTLPPGIVMAGLTGGTAAAGTAILGKSVVGASNFGWKLAAAGATGAAIGFAAGTISGMFSKHHDGLISG